MNLLVCTCTLAQIYSVLWSHSLPSHKRGVAAIGFPRFEKTPAALFSLARSVGVNSSFRVDAGARLWLSPLVVSLDTSVFRMQQLFRANPEFVFPNRRLMNALGSLRVVALRAAAPAWFWHKMGWAAGNTAQKRLN